MPAAAQRRAKPIETVPTLQISDFYRPAINCTATLGCSRNSLFTGSSRLANSLYGSLVCWSTFSQFRSCIGSDYFSRLSLYFNISPGVGVCLLVRSLTVLPLSTSNEHFNPAVCLDSGTQHSLSLFNGGSSVLSSVLSLFFIFLSVTRGACPFARP